MKLACAVIGLLLGAAAPLVELAWDCRVPDSEACVWGKALLPVSISVGALVIGPILAIALFALLDRRRRSRDN